MKKEKDKLYINEKYLLHLIIDYNKKSKVFFYSNKKLASIFEISTQSVSNMIAKLIKLEYIQKNKLPNGKRVLTYTKKPFKELTIFPVQKYVDLKEQNKELNDQVKEIKKLKEELEFYKNENKALSKQLEDLWKKIPEK